MPAREPSALKLNDSVRAGSPVYVVVSLVTSSRSSKVETCGNSPHQGACNRPTHENRITSARNHTRSTACPRPKRGEALPEKTTEVLGWIDRPACSSVE